jgi:CRP/FNR family cyclic AMP-dependent transcriptional regulator
VQLADAEKLGDAARMLNGQSLRGCRIGVSRVELSRIVGTRDRSAGTGVWGDLEGIVSMLTKQANTNNTLRADPYVATFLETISEGKHVLRTRKGETIFSQGDRADAIYFVQTGRVKVSVLSNAGKEGVLAILGARSFFGEDSLAGHPLRVATATAIEPSTVFHVERGTMLRALHDQPDLSERFMSLLLQRNINLEEDLCDHLFNHSEKRLARVLIKLSGLHKHQLVPDAAIIPAVNQETMAEMVGTTRSRISHFMRKFRRMGLIEYTGHHVTLKTERLTDLILKD